MATMSAIAMAVVVGGTMHPDTPACSPAPKVAHVHAGVRALVDDRPARSVRTCRWARRRRIAESRVRVVDVAVLESNNADAATRKALRRLWDRAFGDRFDDTAADHAYGGVHVLVRDGGRLIGHASAVPRSIRFGDQPWRTVGYVEAVATDPERQGEGVGRLAMERLHEEIASRWVAALLSTGRATGFYELLGWQRWLGPTYTQTRAGVVLDGHEGLMVFSCDRSVALDRTVALTCQDRPGDVW